jgi:hypothetical protein
MYEEETDKKALKSSLFLRAKWPSYSRTQNSAVFGNGVSRLLKISGIFFVSLGNCLI